MRLKSAARVRAALLGILALWLASSPALAELVMTAPPRENPEAGQKVYGPLAEYLSEVLGQPVVYRHPGDWTTYGKDMRADRYDIVFDGPHFVAWRQQRLEATPIVKLPGSLQFVLVGDRTQGSFERPEQLFGQKVCHLPSPNLGTLTLYSMFPEPARQPEFVVVRGGFGQVAKAIEQGQCVAGILRDNVYNLRLDAALRERLTVIKTSAPLTNQAITVSARVTTAQRERILKALTQADAPSAAMPLLERFSKNATRFELAGTRDFDGHNLLYDNMIFGW
jgi:ABC-type phosphate/phosphonate transport system substrate-binding protein